ncbi:MAG: hypothetical protein SWE60_06575 [Thermodesulfobacteriota bacterium]|nr:hypothetical protein [Thermodesulfobacteriota bacterium]
MAPTFEKGKQQRLAHSQSASDVLKAFVAGIPQTHVALAGRVLGMVAYFLDLRHRRIVRRNLQFTHPEWSKNRIRRLAKGVFQSVGVTFAEICQMTCFSDEDILRKVRIKGEENLLSSMKSREGVILISAHLGNWEMAHLAVSCYLQGPLVLVARRIDSRRLHRWLNDLRSRFGSVVLDKRQALGRMARALKGGGVVGLLIDQGTRQSEGVEVTFLGRTTTATPAAALLARRYKSTVLPAFCVRQRDGKLTLLVEPPLKLQRTQDPGADLRENTQRMTSALEAAVRAYPEQWFWFHKRWKRHYPYLYREDLASRQRRRERRRA